MCRSLSGWLSYFPRRNDSQTCLFYFLRCSISERRDAFADRYFAECSICRDCVRSRFDDEQTCWIPVVKMEKSRWTKILIELLRAVHWSALSTPFNEANSGAHRMDNHSTCVAALSVRSMFTRQVAISLFLSVSSMLLNSWICRERWANRDSKLGN